MSLASSGDPGPPSFFWVLWWAVQKQHSQQLLPNLNYAVHLHSLTRQAGTMTFIMALTIWNTDEQHEVQDNCFMFNNV